MAAEPEVARAPGLEDEFLHRPDRDQQQVPAHGATSCAPSVAIQSRKASRSEGLLSGGNNAVTLGQSQGSNGSAEHAIVHFGDLWNSPTSTTGPARPNQTAKSSHLTAHSAGGRPRDGV